MISNMPSQSTCDTPRTDPLADWLFSPERLAQAIEERSDIARTKKRKGASGQLKSQLAVLLAEAQRTNALRAYRGFTELGQFVRALDIEANTFAKYKAAGKSLFETDRALYFDVLRAIRDERDVPPLPDVSKLAALPSLRKQASGGQVDIRDALSLPMRATTIVSENESYGTADSAGRKTLSALDGHLLQLTQLSGVLETVNHGGAGELPEPLLQRRVAALLATLDVVRATATKVFEAGQRSTATSRRP